ncbi:PIN domain-containing protein [Athalassotoga sp.]|uniref:PIN domain-containing protein n=2 Tax=Athalassotoga sp. TaxID=2022597 RepID=UPI003D053872
MAKLVMVDTNVFISSLLSPRSKVSEVVEYAIKHERIVLCKEILDELTEVAKRTKNPIS